MKHVSRWSRRRLLLAAIPLLGLGEASILVVRNQLRHRPGGAAAALDGKQRRMVLAVPYPHQDPVLLAVQDQGIFERYQLEVSFADGINSGRQALDWVQAGQADGAVASALAWLPRLQAGLPAKLLCGLRAGSSRLLVAPGSRIRRIEDLHRRAIAITDLASADRLFFSIVMRRKGMNPNKDVEWRAIPQQGLGLALSEGHVQAIAGHDPSIWQLRQSLRLAELASSQSGSYAVRVSHVLGLRDDVLRDDPNAAVAITLAFQEAASWAGAHRAEISGLLAANDPDLTLAQVQQMLRAEGADVHPTGPDLRNQIAQYMDELKLIGVTPEDIDSTRFAKSVTVLPHRS